MESLFFYVSFHRVKIEEGGSRILRRGAKLLTAEEVNVDMVAISSTMDMNVCMVTVRV